MPGLDGFGVGACLKQDQKTKDISIIMVTAKGEKEDVLRAISDAGAMEYIIKPFRMEVLLEKVKYVLSKKNNA